MRVTVDPDSKRTGFDKPPAEAEPRRFEPLLSLVWGLGTLLLSINVIGAYLFLVYLYGWGRVRHEHLRILKMANGQPWVVSNGDLITEHHFIHYLISGVCWFVLFFATYPLIRLLLPKRASDIEDRS
jgi:hypothetical protein